MPVRVVYYLLLVAVLASSQMHSEAAAQTQGPPTGPSLEKCTCKLQDKATENGARAVNATLCVHTLFRERQWCEITIECLRGGHWPGCPTSPGSGDELAKLYGEHLSQIAKDPVPQSRPILEQGNTNIKLLIEITKKYEQLFSSCIEAYHVKKLPYTPQTSSTDPLACYVDPQGWLTIGFNLPKFKVVFDFGPR